MLLIAPKSENPAVLSYAALRKAVGGVALLLPFAVAIPWWILHHQVESSISSYYHTDLRDVFVGALCAISMFMLCARGYDRKDEIAGLLAALCTLGVAFFPTDQGDDSTATGVAHYAFAAILFLILAFFCLVLFRMTAADRQLTRQKLQRNHIYVVCGVTILVSILAIAICSALHVKVVFGAIAPKFLFETTSLFSFGVAWLVKGETIFKDQPSR